MNIYMGIGQKFFHDKLIVDFFSHTPSFFVSFEFFKSFDLNRRELTFLFSFRSKERNKPLRRISIEARVRPIDLNNILWKEEILNKREYFILFAFEMFTRLERNSLQSFDTHGFITEHREKKKKKKKSERPIVTSSPERRGGKDGWHFHSFFCSLAKKKKGKIVDRKEEKENEEEREWRSRWQEQIDCKKKPNLSIRSNYSYFAFVFLFLSLIKSTTTIQLTNLCQFQSSYWQTVSNSSLSLWRFPFPSSSLLSLSTKWSVQVSRKCFGKGLDIQQEKINTLKAIKVEREMTITNISSV